MEFEYSKLATSSYREFIKPNVSLSRDEMIEALSYEIFYLQQDRDRLQGVICALVDRMTEIDDKINNVKRITGIEEKEDAVD